MKEVTTVAAINQWILEKQALEMALAKDLLKIFNESLIEPLRQIVIRSVDDMDKYSGEHRATACRITRAASSSSNAPGRA